MSGDISGIPSSAGDGGAKVPMEGPTEDVQAATSRRLEVGCALVSLAASVVLIWLSRTMELRAGASSTLGPPWWPTVLGIGGVVLSVVLLVIALTREPAERDVLSVRAGGRWPVLVLLAATVGYVLLWQSPVGYAPATALFAAAAMWISGARNPWALVLYPLAVTGLIVLLFGELLRVPL